MLAVEADDLDGDHGVAVVAFLEQGAQRAVDEAGGEGLLGGLLAFTLEPAAGELAGGEGRLAVVDREREEVDALPGLGPAHGHQNHGAALADDDGAIGLFGDAASLQADGGTAEIDADGGGGESEGVHEFSWDLGPNVAPGWRSLHETLRRL